MKHDVIKALCFGIVGILLFFAAMNLWQGNLVTAICELLFVLIVLQGLIILWIVELKEQSDWWYKWMGLQERYGEEEEDEEV